MKLISILIIADDQKERERDLVTAEMIPTSPTRLSFWQKFFELHYKMLFANTDTIQNHMYSSEPLEWPLLSRGIAYWVSTESNVSVLLDFNNVRKIELYVLFVTVIDLIF